jgi:hypothetical protein
MEMEKNMKTETRFAAGSAILTLLTVMLAFPASPVAGMLALDEPYVEQSRGYILYLPTLQHADASLELQVPSGLIPTSPRSRVATAEDISGRMLELAAAYRYTGDEKYGTALERLWGALDALEERYGYYPEVIGMDGTAYSVFDAGAAIHDAVFLSKAILGEEALEDNVSAVREVAVRGYIETGEKECTGDECAQVEKICPYTGYTKEGKEKRLFVCAEGSSTLLEVEYTVPLDMLRRGLNTTDIAVLKVRYKGEEIAVDEGGIRGIRMELLPYAQGDMLRAIAEGHLQDERVRRGFSQASLTREALQAPLAKLGYQARLLLVGEETPPWRITRYARVGAARKYLELCREYCLLKGAAYLPGLVSVNSTHVYEFWTKENLSYGESNALTLTGSKAVYAHQGEEPRFEGVTVEYRPVRKRRIHIAGTLDSLLEAKFGASTRVLGYVETKRLPSGVYNVTALREKLVEEEVLEGTVQAWKPSAYRRGEVVQFPTLSLLESERLYKQAIQEQDPEKFFLAADNLLIHSPRGSARQAMLAMLSLDPGEAEKLARMLDDDPRVSHARVMRTFEEFRRWYADRTMERVVEAVTGSLQADEHSPRLEETLMYLSLEAERTGLPTAPTLRDIYEGYKAYFSPHTKDYDNLVRMAAHLPAYRGIVEALESGEYSRAREMISSLPPGRPREIFFREVEGVEKRLSSLKEKAVEALKAGEYEGAARLLAEHEELARSLGEADPEVSIMKGVASGIALGRISGEDGRRILSLLDEFEEWRAGEEPEPIPHKPILTPPKAEEKHSRVLLGIAIVAIALAAGAVLAVKRRKRPRRR